MKRTRSLDEDDEEMGPSVRHRAGVDCAVPSERPFAHAVKDLAMLIEDVCKDDEQATANELMMGELTELNLNDCGIGDFGAEIVADFLKHDKTVTEVWLARCFIGPDGCRAIAEGLKYNKVVEGVNLSQNQIGREGFEALIDALSFNVCITRMNVQENSLGQLKLPLIIRYLTITRNKCLIPNAVRRAALLLIAAGRTPQDAGDFTIFPKEIVKMIAMEVWATNKDPVWLDALSESERMPK